MIATSTSSAAPPRLDVVWLDVVWLGVVWLVMIPAPA
jgi:hypothetical protein